MASVMLLAVWLVVLLDPQIGPLVVLFLGAFAAALAVMGVAMGLGLLGIGLFAAIERSLDWIRRTSRWPDE